MSEIERDHGPQPLNDIMARWKLEAHDLVAASLEQLTHKQVQRARTGRALTLKMMMKVTRALNVAIWQRMETADKERFAEYGHKHLFTYAKGYQADRADPNEAFFS